MSKPPDVFDAVVVGAGPAGIAAAVTLGEAGKSVALIDDNVNPGGQIWRNRGVRTAPRAAQWWIERLGKLNSVHSLRQSRIVANLAPGNLLVDCPNGTRLIVHRHLVLATGARERFILFPGWTMPGVLGAGALQALIKSGMPVAGKRIVVAGSGPLLLAVADLARSKGASVPLIIEQAPTSSVFRFGLSLVKEPAKLAQAIGLRAGNWRTRYSTGSIPLRVEGHANDLKLTYANAGIEREIECDLLACGFNLIPNLELARALECEIGPAGFVAVDRDRRTSVKNVFAAGEITGIGGVEKALVEGELAGRVIAGQDTSALQSKLRKALRFAARLEAAFAIREACHAITTPETIVCRCEDVTLGQVKRCRSARDAKLQTRCGMGPCQARVCGPTLERIFGPESGVSRPPLMSVPVARFSLETLQAPKSVNRN